MARVLLLVALLQPGCFFKKDKTPPEEVVHDIYGVVESITVESLVIKTKKGQLTLVLTDASIKGGDFGTGATVHAYYKIRENVNEVTMVVEKVE